MKKAMIMIASVIPRLPDNTPDWKGINDFMTYLTTVIEPLTRDRKYKPSFATQENYQELARRLKGEINSSLKADWSSFPSLSQVSELNGLTNHYLSKIFQGNVYADIHKDLAKQLSISNHQQFIVNAPDDGGKSYIENRGWKIALSRFAFKENEPDYSNSTWQDIIDDLKFIEKELDRQILHIESNPLPLDSPYYQKQQDELQSYKLGKQEINSFRARFPTPITEQQQIVNHRTYFRQKWGWMFRNN
jgi:hypothetical protein